MIDREQILSSVDLGEEAPPAETDTEATVDSTAATEVTEETTDEGQVAESAGESQGTEPAQDEAAQAPAKAPDKSKTAKDSIPLAVHLDIKHKLRDTQLRLAQLEARQMVNANRPPVTATPEKSPMEKFVEEHGVDSVPTAKVLMDQKQWDSRQAEQQVATQNSDTANTSVAVALHAMTDEVMGAGLGFETVLLIGNTYLTEGDKLDVRRAGDKAGEVLYQRCLERAIRSGTPQGKLLGQAVRQARTTKMAAPVTKTQKQTVTDREAPSREEILRQPEQGSLSDFFLTT